MSACAASVRALAAEAISGFREGLPMASGPPARPKYARFAFSTMNSLRRKTAIGSAILSRSLLTGLCVPTTVPKCSSRRAETRAISSRDENGLIRQSFGYGVSTLVPTTR